MGHIALSQLEQLIDELQHRKDKSVLEFAMDRILHTAQPELVKVVRLCAIPHWFTPEIIGVLRDKPDAEEDNTRFFATVAGATFVKKRLDGSCAYHDEIREWLLRWWHETENEKDYWQLSGRLAQYFNRFYTIPAVVSDVFGEHVPYGRQRTDTLPFVLEASYHLLLGDEERGLRQLLDIFWMLDSASEHSIRHALIQRASEHQALLSHLSRSWLRYLAAHNLVITNAPGATHDLLTTLLEETKASTVESWVMVDLGHILALTSSRDDARKSYQEAAEHAQRSADDQARAYALSSLGDLFRDEGLLAEAASYYEQALTIHQQRGDSIKNEGLLAKAASNSEQTLTPHQQRGGPIKETHQIRGLMHILRRRWPRGVVSRRPNLFLEHAQGREGQEQKAWDLVESGGAAEENKRWDDALSNYRLALALFEQLESPSSQARVWYSIGDAQGGARRWPEAEAAYQRSLELVRDWNPSEKGWRLYDLGQLEADQERWENTLAYYAQAFTIFEQLEDAKARMIVLYSIGRAHRAAQHLREAQIAYESSLELAKSKQDVDMEGWGLNELGLLAADQESWDNALDLYRQALELFEQSGSRNAQATVLYHIGDAQRGAKRWPEAEEAYEKSLELARELKNQGEEGWRLVDLGLLAVEQELWDKAQSYYTDARRLFDQLNDRNAQTTTWHYIGDAQRGAKRWLEAEEAYKKSLELARDFDKRRMASRLNDLGLLAVDCQRRDKALVYYQEALEIFQELGLQSEKTIVSENLEYVQHQAEGWQSAGQIDLQNWEQARRLSDCSREGWRLTSLGLLAQEQQHWDEALAYYQRTLALFQDLALRGAQLVVWHNIGAAHAGAKSWAKAEQVYHQGLALAHELHDSSWIERFRQALTAVEQEQKK